MKQWYGGFMREGLLGLEKGQQVFYRRAELGGAPPLKVGSVTIIFSVSKWKSVRICDSLGVFTVVDPFPNRMHPTPAPAEHNSSIEEKYQQYLLENPLARRMNVEERAMTALSLSASVNLTTA